MRFGRVGHRTQSAAGGRWAAFLGVPRHRHCQGQGLLSGDGEVVDFARVPLYLRHQLVLVRRLDCPAAVAAHSPHHR